MSRWLDLDVGAADDLLVVPAIDLMDGRVVRLLRGRYDRATRYDRDPADAARRFVDAGAPAIHVVDLDGAREGAPANVPAVERIATAAPDAAIQVGGGVRSLGDADAFRSAGADAVIVGSRAAGDPGWVGELVDELGAGAVIGSLDLRGERIAVEGWTREVEDALTPAALATAWRGAGLRRLIVTDADRDGTLSGVGRPAAARFDDLELVLAAAGGVAAPDDLRRLARAGVAAAIVGRALYEGAIDVAVLADRGWRWNASASEGKE